MLSFILILLVTLTLYHLTKEHEGFFSGPGPSATSPSGVNLPIDKVVRRLSSLPSASPSASTASASPSASPSASLTTASLTPGPLPTAPFEQTASMSPLPYQDTTDVKANRQQLVSALEMLKGFLAYEAPHLEERSDPTIQLPLQTARSDFFQLQNEVSVLNRNPGIQPTIPLTHLNDISANLAFLQQKVRLLGTAGALQGPIYSFREEGVEGFTTGAPSAPPAPVSSGQVATEAELKSFLVKVEAERARLSASATTDPVIQGRVRALTEIRQTIRVILEQLYTKKMLPTEVPILKSDLDSAFPVLGKPSEPLPQLIRALQLPPELANLLPPNVRKDRETTRQIAKLVDKYADTIVNGISARFEVAYTPPALSEKARRAHSTIDKIGFPSLADLENVSQAKFMPKDTGRAVTDRLAALPYEAGRGPSSSSSSPSVAPARFDWKERARQIEDQIRKRGLRPADYGVMPREQKVSNDFSWKGYAKMMCTRLQATMDPALPETCGCPPMDWKGWRN